jgi:quercetin dioxygenase-like cupin family protein
VAPPSSRDPTAEALSRYREALLVGAPAEELSRLAAGLDPGLVATVRWSFTAGRHARPQPDPQFVCDLRRELVQAASASGVTPPSLVVSPQRPPVSLDERGTALSARSAPEEPSPPLVWRPRWNWGQMAAAAVLVFILIGAVLLVRSIGVGRPPTELATTGAPTIETLVDATVNGAADSSTPLAVERWRFQPGATLSIPALDGPQWIVAETGPIVATVDGAGETLAPGKSRVIPAGHTLALRNAGLAETAVLRGVANIGFALEDYDRALVRKETALDTAAHEALPPGPSHIIFDRLTIPPGTTLMTEAATGQDWFSVSNGQLGLTLIGDALPAGWTSGRERELQPGEDVPRLNPGTHMTLHNTGDDPLELFRLRVSPLPVTGSPTPATTPAN